MFSQKPARPRFITFVSRMLALSAVFIFSTSTEVQAMGFLSKVMFSEVQGVLLKDGKPVPNARVKREYHWHWNDKKVSDETITDASGNFRFPLATQSAIGASLLPHEAVIFQEITLAHEGQDYILWQFFKRDYDTNSEFDGAPTRILCDLKTPPGRHIANSKAYGICTLKN